MEKELFVGRSEKKYLMNYWDALRLQQELDLLLHRDAHSLDGSYRVKSLYFDSYINEDFFEKYAGYEKRKKVRLRIYGENNLSAKLELKEKEGEYQHKTSLFVSREEAEKLIQGDYEILLNRKEEIASRFYTILRESGYKPSAVVEYQRLAYIYNNYNTRITFDSKICSDELNFELFKTNQNYHTVLENFVILEVKYNQCLVGFISSILKKYELVNLSVSKYCTSRPIFEKYIV